MLKINRLKAPECLTANNNYKNWGMNYAVTGHSWHWHQYQTNDVDKILRPILLQMTANHCSFCDAYRMPNPVAPTIEHFRPRAIFPLLAYTWHNLFLCCNNCQKNPAGFDMSKQNLRKLLKPDSKDYSFHKFYYFDSNTGRIEIRSANLNDIEIERAKITRDYYQLNDEELIASRLEILEDLEHYQSKDCSKRPYRFMFRDCEEH